jgi:hypothetical protein
MSLIAPNVAEALILQYVVNLVAQDGGSAPAGGQRLLRLFQNNVTPGYSDLISSYTEPSGTTGYAPITLTGAGWTVQISGGTTTALYSQQTFTFTTAVTLYGYYISTTEVTPKLLWVERFSGAPFTLPGTGGQIAIAPRAALQ